MDKKNLIIIGLVAVILIIGVWQFVKPSVTGNVVNTGVDTIIDSETTEEDLTEESKMINEVDYEVRVKDKFTNEFLKNAEVYLDGKLVGKTSSDGKFLIEDLEIGKHNLRAEFKGKISDILSEEVSDTNKDIVLYIEAPRTIALVLKDSETKRPIDNENVFLKSIDGKASFSTIRTDDDGKAQFGEISPGDYTVSIERYDSNPSSNIVVRSDNEIPVDLDMPNPRFRGSMMCEKHIPYIIGSWLNCQITLENEDYERGINSQDTSVLVIVYAKKEGETEFSNIGHQLIPFGDMVVGKPETRPTKDFEEFSKTHKEVKVVAMVYDGWKYTPESQKQIGGNQLSQDLFDKLTTNAMNWCADNVGECIEGAQKVAGIIAAVV